MALTMRTLTGSLLDVQGVPRGANVQQAWIGSSKATIVDAPSTVRVGRIVPLALSGAGAFSVSLPDSAEAGVLYSLWATWVEPTGTRRQAGPTQLGTFHLTANAQIGDDVAGWSRDPEGARGPPTHLLGRQPGAMQLRYMQTLTSIAGDKSSTIVFPLPIELLKGMADLSGKS